MGNLHRDQGRLHEAAEHYRHALRVRPGFHDATTNLALVLAAEGRVEEAVRLLTDLSAARARDPLVPYNLACVLSLAGRTAQELLVDNLLDAVRAQLDAVNVTK